jgi:uncharacterized protein
MSPRLLSLVRFLHKLRFPKAIQVFSIGCLLLFLTSIYAHKIEPNWLEVKQLNIALPHLEPAFQGYRIVQLTDLHVGDGIDRAQLTKMVDTVNALAPDAIVLTGDFVTRNPARHAALLTSTLAGLRARDQIIAVLGNHDVFDGNAPAVTKSILNAGVVLLENTIYTIQRNGATLHIAGVGDVWYGAAKLDRVLAQLPATGAAIMLAHEPDFADETAATGRFGLQLSGHSHGGQIHIPVFNKLPPFGRKYPFGRYQVGEMIQYTSRGIGAPGIHARFNCRPEISVFTLAASAG